MGRIVFKGHMITCIFLNVGFVVGWKGKINCLFLSGLFFISMHVVRKLTRILKLI
jgi:hypothetical protein